MDKLPTTAPPGSNQAAEIRPLVAGDLPGAKRVIDGTGLFPSEMLDEMVSAYLAGTAGEEFWLTAADADGPVGLAYCAPERMTEGTWNTLLIAVHPERQGQGAGRALMRRVEEELAGRGGRLLLVETSGLPEFDGTRAFYRGLGYEEEARIRGFYRAGEDKVVLRKALPAPEAAG
ncbi:N-acetyltransferase family protein [Falsiroseomonas sp. CW058]|uniref:GNAT family N-acetyltransferase n=1 Tax=Falsiroseomonas sp. CW058 TaxID=3388664 RepID=UPI003D31759A